MIAVSWTNPLGTASSSGLFYNIQEFLSVILLTLNSFHTAVILLLSKQQSNK